MFSAVLSLSDAAGGQLASATLRIASEERTIWQRTLTHDLLFESQSRPNECDDTPTELCEERPWSAADGDGGGGGAGPADNSGQTYMMER